MAEGAEQRAESVEQKTKMLETLGSKPSALSP